MDILDSYFHISTILFITIIIVVTIFGIAAVTVY